MSIGATNSLTIVLCVCAVSIMGCHNRDSQTMWSANAPVNKRIVCFGDSLTACGGEGGRYADWLATYLPDCEIINKGISGDTLAGGRARFQKDVIELEPDLVIIELGANDFWAQKRTIFQLRDDLESMVKKAQEQNIKVLIAGVFGDMVDTDGNPIPKTRGTHDFGRKILEMERELTRNYKCGHVENIQADLRDRKYWADSNHPNKEGNRFVAERLLPKVRLLLVEQF